MFGLRNRRKILFTLIILALLLSLGFVPIASYSFAPGVALAVKTQIHVADERNLSKEGKVLMTDILLTQLTPITWMIGHFNSQISIYPAAEVFGSTIPSNVVQTQLGEMSNAKTDAVLAALNYAHLRYQSISGALINGTEAKTTPGINPGDLIYSVNGIRTLTASQAAKLIVATRGSVKLLLLRQGIAVGTLKRISLVARKFSLDGRDVLGVVLSDGYALKLANPISISTGQIGGPSAGLAFSLGVLEALRYLHIDRLSVIGVTGTISPNGLVGDVGGVKQKAIAVARAGAKYFLVPPQEYAAAISAKQKSLHVVAVSSVRQAISFISSRNLGYLEK